MNQSKSDSMMRLLSEYDYERTGVNAIAESFGMSLYQYVHRAHEIIGSRAFTWKYENYCRVYEVLNSPLEQALR